MQIVIDIPEEIYNSACAPNNIWNMRMAGFVCSAIADGTPLPKGHGDLIDRGELKTHIVGTEQGTDLEVYLEPTIINAHTIIEADKAESEDKKCTKKI